MTATEEKGETEIFRVVCGGRKAVRRTIVSTTRAIGDDLTGELRRTAPDVRSDDHQLVIMRRIPQAFGLGISLRLELELDRLCAMQLPQCQ